MNVSEVLKYFFYFCIFITSLSCTKKPDDTAVEVAITPPVSSPKYLYVASGACYSGGNTTFSTTTASNLIFRINATTGIFDSKIADYNAVPANAGDSPAGLVNNDSSSIHVLVENATAGRRIELVPKAGGNRITLTSNTTILSAALRQIFKTSDGGFLVSKGTIMEKVNSQGVRVGAPFIPTALAANCGAANALMTSMITLNNGNIVFSNAVAANNRLSLISAGGYSTAANCLLTAPLNAPVATAFPTAMAYVAASNQLIVAYAGNATTASLNSIYVYDVNETSGVINNATVIYDSNLYPSTYPYLLYGISAMTFDSATNELYVSTGISTATTVVNYAIEKFTYNSTLKTLARVGSVPFYNYGIDTKCISGMAIAD
ncbi:MAG: hypothetical protein AABY64_05650 [Bdellovibrionota bacterium]|mgnify:CR=1 FL=1